MNVFQMKVLSVRSSPLREAQVVCTYSSINVCVVTVVGAIEESSFMEKNHLLGSSGILFVLQLDFTDTVEVSRMLQLVVTFFYKSTSSRHFFLIG